VFEIVTSCTRKSNALQFRVSPIFEKYNCKFAAASFLTCGLKLLTEAAVNFPIKFCWVESKCIEAVFEKLYPLVFSGPEFILLFFTF
jgi:hypothetical protein